MQVRAHKILKKTLFLSFQGQLSTFNFHLSTFSCTFAANFSLANHAQNPIHTTGLFLHPADEGR